MNSENFITTKLNNLSAFLRQKSNIHYLMSYMMGNSCCHMALERDISHVDYISAQSLMLKPDEADLLIVSGVINSKLSPHITKVYESLSRPSYVIAFGNCAISGGPFLQQGLLSGLGEFIPVDIIVPGCPPCSKSLVSAVDQLREKVLMDKVVG